MRPSNAKSAGIWSTATSRGSAAKVPDAKTMGRWGAALGPAVIARLHTLRPSSSESRAALDTLIRYYTTHAARMQYDEYQRCGYGIGSGAVESAHKQVVHARLRQAGMRWSEVGARRLLALRLLLLNGEWGRADQLRLVQVAA